jgi:hypothetical protein
MPVRSLVVVIAHEYALLEHLYILRCFGIGEEVAGGKQLATLGLTAPQEVLSL